MDTLFLILKKALTAFVFAVFAFVVVYVPITPVNEVPQAEAGGIPGVPSIVYDPLQTVQSTLSAVADTGSWTKDTVLDGIAWAIAKRTISIMVTDLIDWVNNDFRGKPTFVTDIRGTLLQAADTEIGLAIEALGGVGSFICAPFRLDVQIAIATQYNQYRGGDAAQSAPTCTLTGIIDNIEGFISGIDPGNGLADWLTITATPQTYTPYGAVLSAQATARARIINAQGDILTEASWGGGFLSQSVCQAVEGTSEQDCTITTPGVVIAGQLNKALGAGQDSLVEADEINELIGALFGNLANKAISGAAGLLGLTPGSVSGYNDSFLADVQAEANNNIINQQGSGALDTITDALRSERQYRNTAQAYINKLTPFIADANKPAGQRSIATILNEEITTEVNRSTSAIGTLTDYLNEYDRATRDRQIEILIDYTNLNRTSEVTKARNTGNWQQEAASIGVSVDIPGLSIFTALSSSTATTSATTTSVTP